MTTPRRPRFVRVNPSPGRGALIPPASSIGSTGSDFTGDVMNAWHELSNRENDGLVVSLLWNEADDRVKVVVADTRLRTQFELPVAPDRALDAFDHPFLYAGRDVLVAPPTRREEVAA
jgi:hypothetical protein